MVRIDLKVIMATFAVLMVGVLGGCAGDDSATVTAPVVILTSPVNIATGVLLREPISVAFSKTMRPAAFTSATFTVTSGNDSVSGEISYVGGYATLTPSAPMLPSTLYTATIAAGVQASDGSALAASHSWNFTTGPLNTAFGIGGVVTTPVSMTLGDGARAVAVQLSDNKIVAVGYVDSGNGNYDFAIARYHTDGKLDTAFGVNGIVITAISPLADEARAVVIQGDGKIVVAGGLYNGADTDFVVARYATNGDLDATFGTAGVVITGFGTGIFDEAFAVAIQSTGKIVVVGQTGNVDTSFALARYTANGTLDTATFGTSGLQTTPFGDGIDAAYSVAIQAVTDEIVVVGITDNVPSTGINNDFALARYDANGALDATFGSSGRVTTAVGAFNEGAFAIGIQSDGKIVVAGVVFNGTNDDFGLVRYDTNGGLDTMFGGGDGIVTTDMGGGSDAALALVIQPADGKIVVAGTAFVTNQGNDFATARYTADGSLDTMFDADGKVITNLSAAHDIAYGVAQSGGNIVLAGSSGTGAKANFVLVGFAP